MNPVQDTNDLPDLEAFVDRVLCDGRYVHTFHDDPGEVAERLGVTLSPDAADEIARTPRVQLVGRVWNAKFRATNENTSGLPPMLVSELVIVSVVVAVVIIVAIIIIRTIWYPSPGRGRVTDNSPNKGDKL